MFTLEEPITVRVYQSAAVVTGIQKPGLSPRRVRFVRVWVRDGLDWKIAIHHGTAIAVVEANAASEAPVRRTGTPLPALNGEEAAVLGGRSPPDSPVRERRRRSRPRYLPCL